MDPDKEFDVLIHEENGPDSYADFLILPYQRELRSFCKKVTTRRGIRWRKDGGRDFANGSHREALVIQTVGERYAVVCDDCEGKKGPFEECVAIRGKHDGSLISHGACANCVWRGIACSYRSDYDKFNDASSAVTSSDGDTPSCKSKGGSSSDTACSRFLKRRALSTASNRPFSSRTDGTKEAQTNEAAMDISTTSGLITNSVETMETGTNTTTQQNGTYLIPQAFRSHEFICFPDTLNPLAEEAIDKAAREARSIYERLEKQLQKLRSKSWDGDVDAS